MGVKVSRKAQAAWDALAEGMLAETPACAGDSRFIADELTNHEQAELRAICAGCPLKQLCRAYALADQPESGYWASKYYGTTKRSKR